MKQTAITIAAVALCGTTLAKVDLVTVPKRDSVQLTIYNSADMTLVREQRALTLKKGENKLQFSWANTLIDPTSLEMIPKANADKIDIQDLVYPPRMQNLGLWNVNSQISGKSPVEISYLTSGLSWRAFYMGTLSPDETKLRLQGYVRVTNNSGEDYENAQTRLIVGQVHLIDQIADLACRQPPYGRPGGTRLEAPSSSISSRGKVYKMKQAMGLAGGMVMEQKVPKNITKEGLSEYFLYTTEGTETIPNQWSKRLPSFDTSDIQVQNLYKFEEDRYGKLARRFLSFKNDKDHKLGDTPIPGGSMKVYRNVDEASSLVMTNRPNVRNEAGSLVYIGASSFKYIPIGEKVELDLGPVQNIIVEPRLMKEATDNYKFRQEGNITGWDETKDYKIDVRNTRPVPVKVEITRNFGTPYWKLTEAGDFGTLKTNDMDTVKFTLQLMPKSKKTFTYQLTTYHGDNQQ